MRFSFSVRRGHGLSSFTLIELLTVIAIIAILAALTLAAAEGVMKSAARARAKSEIQAVSTALESYKTDNGIYPWTNSYNPPTFASTNQYTGLASLGLYQASSQALYEALSGKTNFTDLPSTPPNKYYMSFKANQLGNVKGTGTGSGSTYVQDPFGYSYGYYASPDTNAPPVNGAGFFDMWSTGGDLTLTNVAPWISNWTQ